MKYQTWVILDVSYLAWRAYHAMGKLSHENMATGVMYGIFRDLMHFADVHQPDGFVFCFDYGKSLREVDYPGYKGTRRNKEWTDEEIELHKGMKKQIKLLRTEYLSYLGYQNIFYERGYEADDIIASVCDSLSKRDLAVIVTGDHDMYQLLSERVSIYSPYRKQTITKDSFCEEYGIEPAQWVDVKALAGCSSDDVAGIKGIGEKTACKFLQGKLKSGSAAFQKIVKGNKIWKANKHLVDLPYPGCPEFELTPDRLNLPRWRKLTLRHGMKSISQTPPLSLRQSRRAYRGKAKEAEEGKRKGKGFFV